MTSNGMGINSSKKINNSLTHLSLLNCDLFLRNNVNSLKHPTTDIMLQGKRERHILLKLETLEHENMFSEKTTKMTTKAVEIRNIILQRKWIQQLHNI